ncbi:MAG: uroporphyrinogen-III C-methyltransferase [Pirellulaceae bacterium]
MPYLADSVQPPFSEGLSSQDIGPAGKVYLVGAGPGDPGLLTLRGLQCLQRADSVLYDGLANEQLLEFAGRARAAGQCISVGKHGRTPIWTQPQINAELLRRAEAGQQVVRLKGGDPAVFARSAEELDALSAAGIAFEVVPGITAALAAASYVGIPLTHRHHASAVALVTGQQQAENQPQDLDWDALARFPGTLVFYMGVTTVGQWTAQLLAAGKSSRTPAAIVRRCTWSDQTVIRCSLGEVAEQLTPASKMRPPVIVIVGEVAALGENLDWFSARPLHGYGVMITRTAAQSSELAERLSELGAEVFQQPVYRVTKPVDRRSLDDGIAALGDGSIHGITFSSSHAVTGIMEALLQQGFDARVFAGVRLAAVGPATAQALLNYGLRCDLVAGVTQRDSEPSAAGLLELLGHSVRGERWLVTTTNRSGHLLAEELTKLGANASECLVYETQALQELEPSLKTALANGRIQWATATSAFVAEAAHTLLGEYGQQVKPVAMSNAVAQRLKQLGWSAAGVSREHSMRGMVEAILEAASALNADE